MPPRRSKKGGPPPGNSTLAKFFTINSSKPQPPRPAQPTLESLLRKAASASDKTVPKQEGCAKPKVDMDMDVEMVSDSSMDGAGARILQADSSVLVLSDSDSDDGLVDAAELLGTGDAGTPSNYNLRAQRAERPGSRPPLPALASRPAERPYRNSLKSLVRESRRQKYDLSFLDAQVDRESSGSDGEGDEGAPQRAIEGALSTLPREYARRVRSQLGGGTDAPCRPVRLSLFTRAAAMGSAGRLSYGDGCFGDLVFSDSDPVERTCQAHAGDPRFFRHLIGLCWMKAQAHRGWKLTQSTGDVLVRAMCLDRDDHVAACALSTLRLFLDLGISAWTLRQERLFMLVEELQGAQRDLAEEQDDGGDLAEEQDDGASTSRDSTPSVYVEIALPDTSRIAQTNAERVAYLVEVAARSLEFLSVEGTCRVLVLFFACLLDHNNQMHYLRIQQGLADMIDCVVPPSKWSLVWPECVARLGKVHASLPLRSQLHVVDSIPTSNKRCMQIRHSLSFLFLRLHTPECLASSSSIEGLAASAVLPSQIIIRMVSDMMDPTVDLFRVGPATDYRRLEAAVGHLSNVLDNVQALRGVREEAQAIHQRLSAMNRRINDGVADRIDKTLAKDAVQTLLVRVFLTAVSTAEARLGPVYASKPLDAWVQKTQRRPSSSSSKTSSSNSGDGISDSD
ncbi:hypothetical protein GGF46_005320 [Coemansia sp. RSA 552]|nr:hypothetical protein GGF46_005320 [Coemansia sp. RSA 552]